MDAVLSCSLGLRYDSGAVAPGVDVIKDNSDGSNSSGAVHENDLFTHFDLSTLLWSFVYLQGACHCLCHRSDIAIQVSDWQI
ncbi:hypothetical protein V5799_021413 [Amblyomma americanum]|uniref:Uncharacterized protein n=1 Tax=Amblyomma americanum TaxID=6943 RepID=A0AAQ4FNF7_AMBAM